MVIGKPRPGSSHGEHTGLRDVMAREGCPICRATLVPEGTSYFGRFKTFGDLVDGIYFINPAAREQKVSQYIIWNPKSSAPPTVIHDSRPAAIKIAYQMSASTPGEEFYICKLVGKVSAPEPKPHHETLDG